MRPITDRMYISREKLAQIVDSSAAALASLAPISAWIGFELSLIAEELANLEAAGADMSGVAPECVGGYELVLTEGMRMRGLLPLHTHTNLYFVQLACIP
jgi:hypothetical protein